MNRACCLDNGHDGPHFHDVVVPRDKSAPPAEDGTGTPEQGEPYLNIEARINRLPTWKHPEGGEVINKTAALLASMGSQIASMTAAPPEPDPRAVIEKLRQARGIVNEPMGVSVNEANRAVRLLTEAIDELAAAVKGER